MVEHDAMVPWWYLARPWSCQRARWHAWRTRAAGRTCQHAAEAAQRQEAEDRTTGDGITTGVVIACWLKRDEHAFDGTAQRNSRGKQVAVSACSDEVKLSGEWNMHGSESATRCTVKTYEKYSSRLKMLQRKKTLRLQRCNTVVTVVA
jgi:hypothetical protein